MGWKWLLCPTDVAHISNHEGYWWNFESTIIATAGAPKPTLTWPKLCYHKISWTRCKQEREQHSGFLGCIWSSAVLHPSSPHARENRREQKPSVWARFAFTVDSPPGHSKMANFLRERVGLSSMDRNWVPQSSPCPDGSPDRAGHLLQRYGR